MRLSQLYSNRREAFGPIRFSNGFNVVLAQIRVPENRNKDTHCLGKTTLAHLLDFCLLKGRSKTFFLFKHEQVFSHFVFFLEIETIAGGYLTVRRSVAKNTRIAIKRHSAPLRTLSDLPPEPWDHWDLPIEAARQVLDGLLDLRAVKPWSYRMPISYALRTQSDFNDVFQLGKFRGKHAEWKPYIAHMVGFDAELVKDSFALAQQIEDSKQSVTLLHTELLGVDTDLDTVEGLLSLRQQEVDALESQISAFDFRLADAGVNKALIEEWDTRIAEANQQRYYLSVNRKKILGSLEEHRISFDPELAKRLFEEAGQVFPGQLHKGFDDLIRFNQAITDERKGYLTAELKGLDTEMRRIEQTLEELNRKRAAELAFLTDASAMDKYRALNNRLVELRAEVAQLKDQRSAFLRLRDRRREQAQLQEQRTQVQQRLEDNIEAAASDEQSRYQSIRRYLNEFTRDVLDRNALLSTRINKEGNIEFAAEYLGADGRPSSEDQGKTYRQLLCAAFDLAVARAMLDRPYIRFLYHDGLLEGLDNRKKRNLINSIRGFAALGIQQIVTLIDSDLPIEDDGERFAFHDDEIVLVLHDQDDSGRLFRMARW
ncbi:MAG TPA: DUF2326 domain-containing protein [Chromatiaceae bacterium]|jgi:uncharacterized protein YydD (DUF2326 family)|nr:MAG: hypothetical protein N838_24080 [Thiohalocapsa sp. PB-PSB1]QQO52348.1 MAG: DUF2326 domain-containing protein [Thiohalocapsa sp. PB-PSB1]HBG96192.1 DUF2326 domain-containing protein [Chromatiaceae bacterium]HCS89532.1 DUF2326 domain-containing protein [Chromatiaceae bacterium]